MLPGFRNEIISAQIKEAKTFKTIIDAHEMMVTTMYKQLLLGEGVESIRNCLNEMILIAQRQDDDELLDKTENDFLAKSEFLRKVMDRLSHGTNNSTMSEWMRILSRTMYYSKSRPHCH